MYNTANNSFGKLEAGISSSATTFIMQSAYSDLFPEHNGTTDADYFLKFEKKDSNLAVTKREIVKVTERSDNIFTIERGSGFCPSSDTAETQTNTAFSFDAADSVSLTITSEHIQQIETDIESKANDDEVVHNTGDETITGIKTFSSSPIVPTPTTDMQASTKKYVDDNLSNIIEDVSALYETGLIAGEVLIADDSVFIESLPTFTEATSVQNIGDVTNNTRVAILGFGSGVASNTLKLALRKFASPTANLSVRIEIVSGGVPTGTLVDANATATVISASLTTSLVDTTITLVGSITITKGQQVAIVLSQVGDVVDATNYYGVGYLATNTSTRQAKTWGGSVRTDITVPTDNAPGFLLSTNGVTSTIPKGVRIRTKNNNNTYIKSVTKHVSCTATRALIKTNTGNTILASTTFVGNIATFAPSFLISNTETDYRIECDNNGSNYNSRYQGGYSFPVSSVSINYIASSWDGADSGFILVDNIVSVQTEIINNFPYVSSEILTDRLIAKTSTAFSYKLPTDYARIVSEPANAGADVKPVFSGLYPYTGLTANTVYYASNTAGLISSTPGMVSYAIGITNSNGVLNIDNDTLYTIPSANVKHTTPTISVQGATLFKVASIKCFFSGNLRTIMTMFRGNDGNSSVVTGRIYKDGVAIGTLRTGGTYNSTAVFTEDFYISLGDVIELYRTSTWTIAPNSIKLELGYDETSNKRLASIF